MTTATATTCRRDRSPSCRRGRSAGRATDRGSPAVQRARIRRGVAPTSGCHSGAPRERQFPRVAPECPAPTPPNVTRRSPTGSTAIDSPPRPPAWAGCGREVGPARRARERQRPEVVRVRAGGFPPRTIMRSRAASNAAAAIPRTLGAVPVGVNWASGRRGERKRPDVVQRTGRRGSRRTRRAGRGPRVVERALVSAREAAR